MTTSNDDTLTVNGSCVTNMIPHNMCAFNDLMSLTAVQSDRLVVTFLSADADHVDRRSTIHHRPAEQRMSPSSPRSAK